jgi:drug/metabolite transporter (DMT)-like permease
METGADSPATWKKLLAFAIIYFVWGSTYLAIRISVREMPPLLCAAMRFVAAGLIVFLWAAVARRERLPSARQWLSVVVLATLIFLIDYGCVFWAEQRVPSGLTAVMLGTIPAFMALSEIAFLRTQKLTLRLAVALLIGIAGVGALTSRSLNLSGEPIDRVGAVVLLCGAMSWSIASAMAKKLPLPESKAMSAGAQMLSGGAMLTLASAAFGEFRNFQIGAVSRDAWLALAYLTVFGSIIAFTAYVWLLHHESPTRVGTYAYVNPVVAVLLGYFLAGESLGMRTVLGTAFVLVSVVTITTTRTKKSVTAPVQAEDAA